MPAAGAAVAIGAELRARKIVGRRRSNPAWLTAAGVAGARLRRANACSGEMEAGSPARKCAKSRKPVRIPISQERNMLRRHSDRRRRDGRHDRRRGRRCLHAHRTEACPNGQIHACCTCRPRGDAIFVAGDGSPRRRPGNQLSRAMRQTAMPSISSGVSTNAQVMSRRLPVIGSAQTDARSIILRSELGIAPALRVWRRRFPIDAKCSVASSSARRYRRQSVINLSLSPMQ